jgi:hypothetical protein
MSSNPGNPSIRVGPGSGAPGNNPPPPPPMHGSMPGGETPSEEYLRGMYDALHLQRGQTDTRGRVSPPRGRYNGVERGYDRGIGYGNGGFNRSSAYGANVPPGPERPFGRGPYQAPMNQQVGFGHSGGMGFGHASVNNMGGYGRPGMDPLRGGNGYVPQPYGAQAPPYGGPVVQAGSQFGGPHHVPHHVAQHELGPGHLAGQPPLNQPAAYGFGLGGNGAWPQPAHPGYMLPNGGPAIPPVPAALATPGPAPSVSLHQPARDDAQLERTLRKILRESGGPKPTRRRGRDRRSKRESASTSTLRDESTRTNAISPAERHGRSRSPARRRSRSRSRSRSRCRRSATPPRGDRRRAASAPGRSESTLQALLRAARDHETHRQRPNKRQRPSSPEPVDSPRRDSPRVATARRWRDTLRAMPERDRQVLRNASDPDVFDDCVRALKAFLLDELRAVAERILPGDRQWKKTNKTDCVTSLAGVIYDSRDAIRRACDGQ